MALTESQIIDVLVLLGLPARADSTRHGAAYVDAAEVRKILSLLTTAEETAVTNLLSQWQPVKSDTDRINAEGLDSDPARSRAHLASLMEDTIGYRPSASRNSSPWPSLRLGRA